MWSTICKHWYNFFHDCITVSNVSGIIDWLFFCGHSATPSLSYTANVEGFNEYIMERTKLLVNDCHCSTCISPLFCKQGLTPYLIYSGLSPFHKIGAIYTCIKYWLVIRMAEEDFINFSKIHSKKCWKIYQWRLPSVTLVLSDPLIISIRKVPQKHTIL